MREKIVKRLKELNIQYTDYQLNDLIYDIEIALQDGSDFIYVTDGIEDKELSIKGI